MDRIQLWTTLALAPLAAYALAPATAPLAAVPLIAATLLAIKAFLAVRGPFDDCATLVLTRSSDQTAPNPFQGLLALLLPLLSLTTGTSLSLALSNSPSSTLSSPLDTFLALSLYALIASFAPLVALAAGELLLSLATKRRPGAAKSLTAVLVPAWVFALAGIIEESAGTGRMGWWVRPALEGEGMDWVRRVGGQVAVDLGVGAAGVAGAMVVWEWLRRREEREGDLLGEGNDAGGTDSTWRKSARKPLTLLAFLATLVLVGPLFPAPAYHPSHPSPANPAYVYPPLKIACVVPTSLVSSSRHTIHAKLDDWLKETNIIAGRGAKVLSWFEGAVELEKGARKEEGEGWEAMGEQERELLSRVGEVCDMYKVSWVERTQKSRDLRLSTRRSMSSRLTSSPRRSRSILRSASTSPPSSALPPSAPRRRTSSFRRRSNTQSRLLRATHTRDAQRPHSAVCQKLSLSRPLHSRTRLTRPLRTSRLSRPSPSRQPSARISPSPHSSRRTSRHRPSPPTRPRRNRSSSSTPRTRRSRFKASRTPSSPRLAHARLRRTRSSSGATRLEW